MKVLGSSHMKGAGLTATACWWTVVVASRIRSGLQQCAG
jgi:hypothetical protein